jgi:hypothetical protein
MKQDRGSRRPPWVMLALLAQSVTGPRVRSEDRLANKVEYYEEDGNRINVLTESAYFEKAINSTLSLQGTFVYDSISGASPTGAPPPPGSHRVPVANLDDTRYAGNLQLGIHFANHTLSPQFSYSSEHDYTSLGLALNDAIEFNQKNTTLTIGVAHDFDQVEPVFWPNAKRKDSTDFLIGVTQLLNPQTYITVNGTVGYSDGYLADPYKRFRFTDYPDPTSTFPEKRPGHKSKEVLYVSATHYFNPVNASLEASYRFYHDSFDIYAQTVGLTWFQKIGKHVILAPFFRYYYQTAADFYHVQLPGDPSDPANPTPIPSYYSADYRLSEMETFTYGGKVIFQINDHFRIDGAYTRYDMEGLDGRTSQDAYPKANVFSLGGTWSF